LAVRPQPSPPRITAYRVKAWRPKKAVFSALNEERLRFFYKLQVRTWLSGPSPWNRATCAAPETFAFPKLFLKDKWPPPALVGQDAGIGKEGACGRVMPVLGHYRGPSILGRLLDCLGFKKVSALRQNLPHTTKVQDIPTPTNARDHDPIWIDIFFKAQVKKVVAVTRGEP